MIAMKKEIRFKNLSLLLKDMEIKKWVIDSFLFLYKNKNYIVILKLYKENEKRPSKYAKATVEFIKQENVNVYIMRCIKQCFRQGKTAFFGYPNYHLYLL